MDEMIGEQTETEQERHVLLHSIPCLHDSMRKEILHAAAVRMERECEGRGRWEEEEKER